MEIVLLSLGTITLSHVPGVIKRSVEPVATCIVWNEPDKEILKTLGSKGWARTMFLTLPMMPIERAWTA